MDLTAASSQALIALAPKPQKAFAIAFAVLALGLAGCASGLGVSAEDQGAANLARVEDGTLLASRPVDGSADGSAVAYTVKLHSGELATISQPNGEAIAAGTPVLVEYNDHVRVIPQNYTVGY
jgi:outer membrane lipoprotein SlyB